MVTSEVTKPSFECLEAESTSLYFNQYQIILANFIATYYCANLGVVYSIFSPFDESCKHNVDSNAIDSIVLPYTLTKQQNLALDFIKNHQSSLLFGDTGSGKTEIYINAILDTIKEGKNAIFLIPEISLTPQIEQRMRDVFGDLVCVWHSKISKSKKKTLLSRIQTFKVIVGARSSLFLPIENIGLIIVDEEHDDSYKSNTNPRYNARDCSIYLGVKCGIKVILGSATPSASSYYHFSRDNRIFRLKGRYFDSKKVWTFEDSPTKITPNLLQKISNVLEKKKQIIIFVPIRANFKTILCMNCGSSIKCKNCSISMSFHSNKNALICHYCGWSMPLPKKCPSCSNGEFIALKMGTQEITKELKAVFSKAKIEIFDRDEITTDSKLKRILNDFNNQKIDILVGTQMISKGHDYHNVYLVVILGIDNLLSSNDFRAYERAVSLVYQVAGRCARKDDGEVFIQTLNKEFFMRFGKDYEDFLIYELQHRVDFYPPFRRLALICTQSKNDKIARNILESCKKIVESCKSIEIVGVSKAPIERIKGNWRYFMLLKAKSPKELLSCLHLLKNEPIIIDIDPIQLL